MRIRSVKPQFFGDRVTGRFAPELALFYIAMWCFADDEGRFEWEPEKIQGSLFPYRGDTNVEGFLQSLVAAGRIVKYEVDGVTYGVILTFKEHQKPQKPQASKIPAPPVEAIPERYRSVTGSLFTGEERRGEGEDSRGEESSTSSAAPQRRRGRPSKDPRVTPLTDRLVATYATERGEPYKHGGARDAVALKAMLAVANEDEIERRWLMALRASGWTRCNTFAQLNSKWNDLGARAKSDAALESIRRIVDFDPVTRKPIYDDAA